MPFVVPLCPHTQPHCVPTDDEDSDCAQESPKDTYKDQRRRAHTQAEQKRRDAIKVSEAQGSRQCWRAAAAPCPPSISVLLLELPSLLCVCWELSWLCAVGAGCAPGLTG